jgi:lysophospholipase L1-like esterase
MGRLTVVVVAAFIALATDATAGFWLPPDFGGNNFNLAVAVGDSITLGTLANGTASQPYPLILQSLLAPDHPGFVVVNRGVGGETTSEGRARFATVLAALHPGFVLIMEGTNDATLGVSPDVIVDNLRAMVQLAKANFSIPILGAIIPNHRDSAPVAHDIIDQVNARLPGVAAAEGVRFVDTFTPMSDPGLFGSDRLHPTQEGYSVLATAWRPEVSAAITESRALLGGVRVAGGNIDGIPGLEIITGPGPGGGPHVKAFKLDAVGTVVAQVASFFAYAPNFLGGIQVASGCDFDGDGRDEIVTGAGPGGEPHVRVFRLNASGNPVAELAGFFAYHPAFTGGVFVACGDVDGDGVPEIITGAGRGAGPHVRILRYAPTSPGGVVPLFEFFAYAESFTGGVHVAVGDVDGDGRADIITGAGAGGGPHVRALKLLMSGGTVVGALDLASFFAYHPAFPGGVFVAAGDLTSGGVAQIITGPGRGGGPHTRILTISLQELAGFFAYDPSFSGGVFVGTAGAQLITGAGPGGGPHVRGFAVNGAPTTVSFFAY